MTARAASTGMRVAGAPISWGVWGPDSPVDPVRMLNDLAVCGYAGTELGPTGFFPDLAFLRRELRRLDVALVGTFVDIPLTRAEARGECIERVDRAMDALEAGKPGDEKPLVIISDSYDDPARLAAAGRIEQHPETWLGEAGWGTLIDGLHAVSERCRERGFDAAVHPHGGSHVETEHEIETMLSRTDPALIGLCLDTGHAYFGGHDPGELLREHRERLRLVHLKDVDLEVMAELHERGYGIDEAWRRGVFCPLGSGGVDLDGILTELRGSEYGGWVVVEQDRVLEGAEALREATETERLNRSFLSQRGL